MDIKEQQALLESLSTQKSSIDNRIARLEARKEADMRQWSEKSQELKAEFGTDNLTEIKEKLDKEKAENEKKLMACQSALEKVAHEVDAIEKLLAESDGN